MSVLDDVGEYVADLERRIYTLEMQSTSSAGGGSNVFKEVIITDGDETVVLDLQNPAPAAPTVTWGSFETRIYADVDWADVPEASGYTIEYAKKIGAVYQLAGSQTAVGSAGRVEPLEPLTTYGFRVYAQNHAGVWSVASPWTDLTTGKDASIPAPVANVLLGRGATSVIVKWDPNTESDVAGGKGIYLIQISNNNFASVYAQQYDGGPICAFNDITAEGTFKARVSAIDTSGNQGPYGESSPYTAGGVIDNMLVGDFNAAHITFGTMSGGRIAANSANIQILTTSTLTSAQLTINGGDIRILSAVGGVGMLLNSQGLSLYDNSGTRKVFLDALTGDAQFSGTLVAATGTFSGTLTAATINGSTITGGLYRTAMPGTPRLELSSSHANYVKFYGSTGDYQGQIWSLDGSNSVVIGTGVSDYDGSVASLTIAAYDNLGGSDILFSCDQVHLNRAILRGEGGGMAPKMFTSGGNILWFNWTGTALFAMLDAGTPTGAALQIWP